MSLWALLVGVVILAFPTALTAWPARWGRVPPIGQVAVFVAWLALAVVFVVAGLYKDQQVADLAQSAQAWRARKRSISEGFLYQSVLKPDRPLPENWSFTIFVFVPDEGQEYAHDAMGQLEPLWPIEAKDDPVLVFRTGNGATGLAWTRNALVLKYGDEVHNATHGLTEEQQVAFAQYRAVVSVPIYSDVDEPLGVLSGICETEDRTFDRPEMQALLRNAAEAIGAVLSRSQPTSGA